MTDNPMKFTLYLDTERRELALFYRPPGELKRRVDFTWEEGQTRMGFVGDVLATEPVPE